MGVAGFGGPMAHIALMQQRLVERKRWLNSSEFASALAVTNLIPGPNSTEMAIHLGYLRAGRGAGLLAGLLFILPAFLMMLGLSWAYFRYDDVGVLEDFFRGVKPVVPAIVLLAAWALARHSFGQPSLWIIGCWPLRRRSSCLSASRSISWWQAL